MRQIFPVLLVSILCGCASTKLTARPTSAAPDNKQVVEGLRYYLPMPYIHVSKPILLASNSTGDSRTTEVTVELAPAAAAAKKKAAPGAGGTRPQSEGGEGGLGAGVNDEKPEEGVKEEEEQEETTSAAAKPAEDGVSIVMLPDFCEQQALNVSVENGKLDVEFKFADGWRLEYVKSSADATAALASWVDLVKTTLTSAKDVATAALGKTEEEEETEEPKDDGDTKAQANKDTKRVRTEKNVVRTQKITETWLHPGVYALFNRNNNDCASRPVLKTDWYSGNTFTRTREQNDGSEQKSQVITQ